MSSFRTVFERFELLVDNHTYRMVMSWRDSCQWWWWLLLSYWSQGSNYWEILIMPLYWLDYHMLIRKGGAAKVSQICGRFEIPDHAYPTDVLWLPTLTPKIATSVFIVTMSNSKWTFANLLSCCGICPYDHPSHRFPDWDHSVNIPGEHMASLVPHHNNIGLETLIQFFWCLRRKQNQ